jgi:hypothetical protein
MTDKQEQMAQSILNHQLALCPSTLEALKRAGMRQDQEVQLDFSFKAKSEAYAKELAAHLEENDCLSVTINRTGNMFSRKYFVEGKTHPTVLNESLLAEWLPWVIVQGASKNCEFDGWGVQL